MSDLFGRLTILILSVLSVLSSQINLKLPTIVPCSLLLALVILSMLTNFRNFKIRLTKKIPYFFYPWIFLCIIVLLGFGNLLGTMRIVCCVFVCYALMRSTRWVRYVVPVLGACTGTYVFFTYFFLLFPQYYPMVIDFYGYVPTGTSRGSAGYRAGIANHYSQNGIFITIFLILITIYMFVCLSREGQNKKKKIPIKSAIFTVLSFIALLLTGKRGVLLFGLCAIIATYYITTKKQLTAFIKIVILLLSCACVLQLLSEVVPEIAYVFERFQMIGEDGASLERLAMWYLAIRQFIQKPILGNGFWSFREAYNRNLAWIWHPNSEQFQYLDAHNVYLQLLSETGIVGFVIYMLAIGLTLYHSIKIIRRHYDVLPEELRVGMALSVCIQIFYCLYSLSGNCLYDIAFYFYAIALAIVLSINHALSHNYGRGSAL